MSKRNPTTYSQAITESPDVPGRTTGRQDTKTVEADLSAFDAAIEKALKDGVTYGVLRRQVELHEWANREIL